DGKKYTAAQADEMIGALPPQVQVLFKRDPKQGLGFILLMRHLAAEAEKNKLDQQSPLKETLEYTRLQLLQQAEVNQVRNIELNVQPDDEMKYYKAHPDQFQEARVKVIYIAYSNAKPADGAKKSLTESEAKEKIEDLRKQIAGGADFAELARTNSDDKESASKGGDFGVIKRGSSYPDAIKNAVFALKPGQVSEPIKQPNGYYLLRTESVSNQPYEQIRTQIYDLLKQQGFDVWMKDLQKRYEVKVENQAYFTPATPAPSSTPPKQE
ncbi:MAG: peptidylprolyl isomerase, partial [Acidobacteriaceae bacterium]|nr:peptidylprolyl isomerase [Acidobacteriaceae bacterium]